MKNLKNLKGAMVLQIEEQKEIVGGQAYIRPITCSCYNIVRDEHGGLFFYLKSPQPSCCLDK